MAITTDFLANWQSYGAPITTDFVSNWLHAGVASASLGGLSSFEYLRRTNDYSVEDGDLSISIYANSDDASELCNDVHTVTYSQRDNETASLSIQINDSAYRWHPYATGGDGATLLVDDAEVSVQVTWGGILQTWEALMKKPSSSADGTIGKPQLTWPGVGFSDKLFRGKKDLETLGSIGMTTGLTNAQIMSEACTLVGLSSDWSAVRSILIGGPYHRQQLTPADVVKQVLDCTYDRWRDEGKKIVGVDPEDDSTVWDYTSADQVIYSHTFSPAGNDIADGVIALRAIATGKLFDTGETTSEVELTDFGEYTVSLPSISAPTTRYKYRDYQGSASGFIYTTPQGEYLREPHPDSIYPGPYESGVIVGATSVTFTWGAANEGVTMAGVTSAPAGILIYGTPHFNGSIGVQPPTDMTTRKTAGDPDGDVVIELSPTPLISNGNDLQLLADKVWRLKKYPIVNHSVTVPLNHLIKCGHWFKFKLSPLLGSTILGPFRITGVQHTASVYKANNRTVLTLEEQVVS